MTGSGAVPLVTAVTTYLDAERFLAEAIDSVLAQSCANWELLLVDDGSTDGSAAIAAAYATRHPGRIRCLEHEGRRNRGISASRNLGIRHGRGDLLAFLDADDRWAPDRLERQLAILDAHPEAGLILGATLYWHGWTGRAEDRARDELIPIGAPQDRVVPPPDLLLTLYPFGDGAAPSMSGLMLQRAVFERAGGFDERFRGMYEDQAFLTKVYLDTPVYVSGACFDLYRQHDRSCAAVSYASGQYDAVRRQFFDAFAEHLERTGVRDPRVWRALRRARRRRTSGGLPTLLRRLAGRVLRPRRSG